MPGGESGSERPIADGVERLNELRSREVPNAIDDVGERIRGDLAEVQRLVDAARRHVDPDLPADLEEARRLADGVVHRLGEDVSDAIASVADELDALRRQSEIPALADPVSPTGSGTHPGLPTSAHYTDEAAAAIHTTLAGAHPDVAAVLARLVADVAHPLGLTRALRDPRRRGGSLAILAELADGRTLAGRTLEQYRAEQPGRGPLFAPVPHRAVTTSDGRSRKETFLAEAQLLDPARSVGAEPSPEQFDLLDDYVRRLRQQVEPQARHEIEALTDPYPDATVSLRVKDVTGLVEKVYRMSTGSENRPARPDYRVGDVVDAVGARITVADTTQLANLTAAVVQHYGFGDGGHVLDMENTYVEPKAHNPAYRVVPLIIGTSIDGLPYTFEIQLSTRRASLAADLEHNTVYKPYVAVDDHEQTRCVECKPRRLLWTRKRPEARRSDRHKPCVDLDRACDHCRR